MPTNRIAGVIALHLGNIKLPAKGGWTVMVDDVEREGIAGQSGVHGYKEMPVVPYMEGTISHLSSISVEELKELHDFTATLETANGRAFVLENAWVANQLEVGTEEGEFTVRVEGMKGREI